MIKISNERKEAIVQITVAHILTKTDFEQIGEFFEHEIGMEEHVNLLL